MNPRLRMWLYALAGLAAGVALKAANGWRWDWPAPTVTGNAFFALGYFSLPVAVALLIGWMRRPRPDKP